MAKGYHAMHEYALRRSELLIEHRFTRGRGDGDELVLHGGVAAIARFDECDVGLAGRGPVLGVHSMSHLIHGRKHNDGDFLGHGQSIVFGHFGHDLAEGLVQFGEIEGGEFLIPAFDGITEFRAELLQGTHEGGQFRRRGIGGGRRRGVDFDMLIVIDKPRSRPRLGSGSGQNGGKNHRGGDNKAQKTSEKRTNRGGTRHVLLQIEKQGSTSEFQAENHIENQSQVKQPPAIHQGHP